MIIKERITDYIIKDADDFYYNQLVYMKNRQDNHFKYNHYIFKNRSFTLNTLCEMCSAISIFNYISIIENKFTIAPIGLYPGAYAAWTILTSRNDICCKVENYSKEKNKVHDLFNNYTNVAINIVPYIVNKKCECDILHDVLELCLNATYKQLDLKILFFKFKEIEYYVYKEPIDYAAYTLDRIQNKRFICINRDKFEYPGIVKK